GRDGARAMEGLREAGELQLRLERVLGNATALALESVGLRENRLASSALGAARALGAWVAAGIILLPLLLYYIHIRFYRPIAAIDSSLDRVMRGDLGARVPPGYDDELGRVGDHFNQTLAVLREREAAESRLTAERARARTRLILDAALDAVIAMDDQGNITEWNPQAERVFGWHRDEVIGRELAETIVPEEQRARHRHGLERYLRTGEARMLDRLLEVEGVRRDGQRIPLEVAIARITTQPDGKVGFSAFLRDISGRRLAESALRESEERYRAAFEQAPMGMAEVGPDGCYLRVNRTYCEIVDREPGDLIGQPLGGIADPSEAGRDDELLAPLLSGERASRSGERRYVKRNGSVVWAHVTLSLVHGPDGKVAYLLQVLEDITGRKRLEEELLQSQKLDAVGRLAGGIAHDFNNLLTGIIGYADLLRDAPDATPHVRQDAEAILLAARRGADLTRNLLAFARRSATRAEPVDLHGIVLEVVELLARTFDRRIEIRLDLSAPSSTLLGDHSQLANSVLNLALNARDAMPNGGRLTISTRVQTVDGAPPQRELKPGSYIVLELSDQGIGMPPETLARAFEPFFTTKAQGRGTGLGLAMVYGTVRAHQGLVTVRSVPGAGTTFTMHLPLAPVQATPPAGHPETPVSGSGRVLVADDEQVIREVAARILTRVGYQVDTVGNGEEAVERVLRASEPYDLVILDWNMPRLSGREACRRILAGRPGTRVVLASGLAESVAAEDLAAEGFVGVVRKPYNLASLSRAVAELREKPAVPERTR
ncbi:MAG TPA: PAS domain S-box protein, partial [Gemmatimonadales bacterium]|nr:PAS domain S-box protein [Gemmatimonadales bacterium]